jgi:peptidoglycan/LPS O-acetylase OafA/YrhL
MAQRTSGGEAAAGGASTTGGTGLGLISYGVYLLSAVLLYALISPHGDRFVPMPHGGLLAYIVHIAFLTALTVPLAMASWRWLEAPLIARASRLGERWMRRAGRRPAPSGASRDRGAREGSI